MATNSVEREAPRIPGPNNLIRPVRPVTNIINTYEGPRGKSLIEAFTGDTYIRNRDPLREIAIKFEQRVFGIDRKQASDEVFQNMRWDRGIVELAHELEPYSPEENGFEKAGRFVAEILHLPKPEKESIDGYIGCVTGQLFMLPTDEGFKKILYMSGGTILDEYRRMGLGAKFFQVANGLHKPHIIMIRVRSGRAIGSLIRSKLVDPEKIFPFYKRWSADPEKEKALGIVEKRTINPKGVDKETGIAESIYLEGWDRAYTPDPKYPESYKWVVEMKELGLVSANGDGMFIAADVIGRYREHLIEESIIEELAEIEEAAA